MVLAMEACDPHKIEKMCDDEGLLEQFRLCLGQALDRLLTLGEDAPMGQVTISILVTGNDGRQGISDTIYAVDLEKYFGV